MQRILKRRLQALSVCGKAATLPATKEHAAVGNRFGCSRLQFVGNVLGGPTRVSPMSCAQAPGPCAAPQAQPWLARSWRARPEVPPRTEKWGSATVEQRAGRGAEAAQGAPAISMQA